MSLRLSICLARQARHPEIKKVSLPELFGGSFLALKLDFHPTPVSKTKQEYVPPPWAERDPEPRGPTFFGFK